MALTPRPDLPLPSGPRGRGRRPAAILLLATILLAAGTAFAAEEEPAEEEPAEAPVRARAALLDETGAAFGPDNRLRLGDMATLTVTVEGDADARIFVPSNPAVEPFRIVGDPAPPERTVEGERVTEVHRLTVTPLRVGAKAIPPIEVVWRRSDGTSGSVSTERLLARVHGRLEDVQDPALAPAPPPAPVIATNWPLIWGLSVVGAAAGAALLTLLLLRVLRGRLEAALPSPPPRPANEVALERLAWLDEAELEPTERYARTVDVLREYLGGRYGFDGLDTTTNELMARVEREDLRGVTPAEIRAVLEDGDLVKFARLRPPEEDARALADRIRRVVEITWVPPEPEEGQEEPERLEPATASERVKAGLVDLALAVAVGLLVLGALWTVRELAWGWTAVLAVGVVLWLRDVAGPGSPGKVLVGLRLVRRTEDQRPPTVRRRLWRNAIMLVAPVGVVVDGLVILYHPLHHGVGDLLAKTEVVRGGRR
ncbi:MAG: RDD family protein [Myxococcota bacterium]